MDRKRRIVPISGGEQVETEVRDTYEPETVYETVDEQVYASEEEYTPQKRSFLWLVPTLALLAIAGWTAFHVWATGPTLFAMAPAAWSGWIVNWAVPVILIVAVWMLALRHSRVETGRFADAAASLRAESDALEERLGRVNAELSMARDFIVAQGRDLEAFGRTATDRLGEQAGRLEALIGDNAERVETLHSVSGAALDNMEQLRGRIPILTNAAKDLTSNIGQAGDSAEAQLERLREGFERIGQGGEASGIKIDALRARVDEAVAEFQRRADQLGEIADARFAALDADGAAFRERLYEQEIEGLGAVRQRAEALETAMQGIQDRLAANEAAAATGFEERISAMKAGGDELAARLVEQERAALAGWRERIEAIDADARNVFARIDNGSRESLDASGARVAALGEDLAKVFADMRRQGDEWDAAIAERARRGEADSAAMAEKVAAMLADLDSAIDARRQRHEQIGAAIARHSETVAGQLAEHGAQIGEAAARAREAETTTAAGLERLNDRLVESREALTGTDTAIARLTDDSVRLLELIEAASRHAREALPEAVGDTESRLERIGTSVGDLHAALTRAGENGEALDKALAGSRETTRDTIAEIDRLHAGMAERGDEHGEQLAALRDTLRSAREESEAMAVSAEATVGGALARLAEASREAVADLEGQSASAVRDIAEKLARESGEAVSRAMRESTDGALDGLDEAVERATAATREAAGQLRDRLSEVEEITGNLERRIDHARRSAEDDIDEHFARRVSQITESLNSTAIDIEKVLSAEVSEAAWQSYLKGERGIFTRRAVRLLDNSQARDVVEHYENDRDFREYVNRYVHDFETMLRTLLATREGNSLAMTVISSDMGKLYVALAQAIERLRR